MERYLANDFTRGIESPKTDDKLPVYMTLTDLKQLFDYLKRAQSRFSKRNELMFNLLATTGLRRSELVSLTWEQVDLVNETIRIKKLNCSDSTLRKKSCLSSSMVFK